MAGTAAKDFFYMDINRIIIESHSTALLTMLTIYIRICPYKWVGATTAVNSQIYCTYLSVLKTKIEVLQTAQYDYDNFIITAHCECK